MLQIGRQQRLASKRKLARIAGIEPTEVASIASQPFLSIEALQGVQHH